MMHPWSIESVAERLVDRAAAFFVGAVHAWDVLAEITRPPVRHCGFDEDAAGEFLGSTCRAPDPSDCLNCGASVYRWPGEDTPDLSNLRGCNLCGGHCNKACEEPNAFEPSLSDDELVGVRGLLQERYEPPKPWPCPVDDCDYEGSSVEAVNTHSYWDHLQPNPFGPSDNPLIEHRRYPGVTATGDFRWFHVKVTLGKSSVAVKSTPGAATGSNAPALDCVRAGSSGEAVSGHSPVAPASPPSDERLFLLDFAADLADAIADHYDHGRGVNLPLYWEHGVSKGIDFSATARELFDQYDIHRK